MHGIMVPKATFDNIGGGDTPFPEGNWVGTIEEVRLRDFPDWIDPSENRGYSSTEGEILSIQLGSNRNIDNSEVSVGNRKHFIDFITRDGTVKVEDAPNIPEKSWQLSRSATDLARLAAALGATEEVEVDGETYVRTSENFLDQLRSGALNGTQVGFSIYHRHWTSKDKTKSGTEARLREFFQAV